MLRISLTMAAMLTMTVLAEARPFPSDPPLPPIRPPDLGAAPVEEPSAAIPSACTDRLRERGYDIRAAAAPAATNSACHIGEPVSLRSVQTTGGSPIRIVGEPILDCRMAESLGSWVTDVAAPIIAGATGSSVRALRDTGGYECRNRNRRPDGKISAHAQGLAMDIGAFELANGRILAIAKQDPDARPAIAALRRAACGWFLTVLGPGSDPDHATHLHLDLQQHGSSDRYRICE